jgi:AmmeMemoRadiSam system protein B
MGFAHSGAVAAYPYKYLATQFKSKKAENLRVFIFGASHFFYTNKCCLSAMAHYDSPFGKVAVDVECRY